MMVWDAFGNPAHALALPESHVGMQRREQVAGLTIPWLGLSTSSLCSPGVLIRDTDA